MDNGVVKWFNSAKGFGFITDSKGIEIFCHFKDIVGEGFRSLKEGDKVEFNQVPGSKGMKATEVRLRVAG